MLSIFCGYKQNDWDEKLTLAEFAYNNAISTSTKMTPFFTTSRQNPWTPANVTHTTVQAAQDISETINGTIQQARDILLEAQQTQAQYAN